MKVEVAVLGSLSLIVLAVSVVVEQHWNVASGLVRCVGVEVAILSLTVLIVSVERSVRAREMCGSRGGHPVPNSPYSLCGT